MRDDDDDDAFGDVDALIAAQDDDALEANEGDGFAARDLNSRRDDGFDYPDDDDGFEDDGFEGATKRARLGTPERARGRGSNDDGEGDDAFGGLATSRGARTRLNDDDDDDDDDDKENEDERGRGARGTARKGFDAKARASAATMAGMGTERGTARRGTPRARARDEAPRKDAADVEGECQGITLGDGRRVYVKKEPSDKPIVSLEEIYARASEDAPLLTRSIEDMLDEYEDERYRRAVEEARAVEEGDATTPMDATTTAPRTQGQIKVERWRAKMSGLLWAQRHAPRAFTDLLSVEHVNREVVHWIKGWDKVVFDRNPPPATMKKFYADRYAEKAGLKKRSGTTETHVQLDRKQRPMEKILLLSGPPGAGKTTLAHVAAKHCGYETIEINASDDRSASTLKLKLADALQTRSAFEKQKPKCVIIDEIDGVHNGGGGGGAIWTVMHALKDVKGQAPLCRPIIAICNDLYAQVLRPLRDVAKIIRMKPPQTSHLTARIRDVCLKENVDIEPRAIALVVDRVDNDIRAALNSIQLIARTSSTVTLRDVVNAGGGSKDNRPQAFSMWQDLLRGRHTFARSRVEDESGMTHMDKMREKIEIFQDNDSLLDGLFENIPNVRFQDGSMSRLTQAVSAVIDGSMFQTKSFTTGDHNLRRYAEACIMAVHSTATHAGNLGESLEWPKTGRAMKERNARMAVLSSRRDAMDLKIIRRSLTCDVTETLPYLNTIIAPELRSVGTSFMTEEEKTKLADVVSLMRAHGLSYKPSASKYNEQSWRAAANSLELQPPVDDFVKFGAGVDALKAVERLTWRERREREREPEMNHNAPQHMNLVPRRAVNNSLRSIIANSLVTDAEKRSGARDAAAAEDAKQRKSDQKARVALGVAGGNLHKARKSLSNAQGAQFKYNEGYTTGVRRTVLMRDLFPQNKA